MTLLDIFELIVKVFKYLLATGELLQFRHLNETQACDDDVDFFERDIDEERLIIRDRVFSRIHEISHYKQFLRTDRTVTSARQARNDDHSEHSKVRRIQAIETEDKQ